MPHKLVPLISREKIAARLTEMAGEICADHRANEPLLAVVVLQGGFIFGADLLRALPFDFPIEAAFVRCQSYGSGTVSSGKVILLQDLEPDVDLHGRTVLLIDDILDTGLTIRYLCEHLRKRGAARVRPCVLLYRRLEQPAAILPDFHGFSVASEFFVGYGLDYNGRYRHLPGLYALDPISKSEPQ